MHRGRLRRWRCGLLTMRQSGVARHRALGIQQMIMTWTKAQADESARVGHSFRLPSVIGLVAPHRILARLVPCSQCRTGQVMFTDERFLYLLCTFWIDLLLPARHPAFAVKGTRLAAVRLAVSSGVCSRLDAPRSGCAVMGCLSAGCGLRLRTGARVLRQSHLRSPNANQRQTEHRA